jgi:hypothetical protein
VSTCSSSRDPRADRPAESDTIAILENVIWIVDHLDGTGLAELGDVPVLELAKHISIAREAA